MKLVSCENGVFIFKYNNIGFAIKVASGIPYVLIEALAKEHIAQLIIKKQNEKK